MALKANLFFKEYSGRLNTQSYEPMILEYLTSIQILGIQTAPIRTKRHESLSLWVLLSVKQERDTHYKNVARRMRILHFVFPQCLGMPCMAIDTEKPAQLVEWQTFYQPEQDDVQSLLYSDVNHRWRRH